jgi:ElaA protein
MTIEVKSFRELSVRELYDALQLRSADFVVEQECIYQDMDGKDINALHVLGSEGGTLLAYTRILAPGVYFKEASIGRVAVRISARGKGFGKEIMKASIQATEQRFGNEGTSLSAQSYLRKFYREMGFRETGTEYLEDGIPHIRMVRH